MTNSKILSNILTGRLLFTTLLLLFAFALQAQVDTLTTVNDTTALELPKEVEEDTIKTGFFSLFKGEPGRAAFYSLLIPGGGQFYNKRYFRSGLAVAADATAIGVAIYWTKSYRDYDDAYRRFLSGEITSINRISNKTTIQRIRDQRRQYRDYSWFAVGVVHLVTVIEAFVDRHLMEFDISDDLTVSGFGIDQSHTPTFVSIQYTF